MLGFVPLPNLQDQRSYYRFVNRSMEKKT
ncbi:hypothetical protein CY0110_19272 [Crocosphaera chwakensis CCY0110]|uniref:Uncharacterized protein n=1 Tax=Crocosphaera chwakensis CCY0110 TaxID=391612 RepID=A3IJI6_9CHRO|nr:hypothetical protein CY0110_19272 [Crocosphaera chwakensis CCY0110]